MAEIMEGLRLIPPVTRTVMLSAAAITLPAILALYNVGKAGFNGPAIFDKFELWRLVTSFLFAGSGLNLLFDAFLFHRTSASLENDTYLLDGAKYAWSLLWIAAGIQLQNVLYFQTYFLFRPFMIGLVHLWARHNLSASVSLFGLVTVPAIYHAPFLLFIDLLQGGPGLFLLGCTGILSSHLYWFLITHPSLAPKVKLLSDPPGWWRESFARAPRQVRTASGTAMGAGGNMAGRAPAAAGGGHTWGTGNRLGS